MKRSLLGGTILLLLLSVLSPAQQWSGIVDPSRAIDWSNAGAGPLPSRPACVTTQCNTVASGTVTTSSLNAAISSAPAGTAVVIPAGTFSISGGITFSGKSNVTVRGQGSNSTFLTFTGSSSCNGFGADVCATSSDVNYWGGPTNTANWTAGYAKGSTSITLSSVSNLKVGQPIVLDQLDDVSDNNAVYIGCEYASGNGGGSTCYSGTWPSGMQRSGGSGTSIRGQQQMVTVTSCGSVSTAGASCSGSNVAVGISPGLYAPNWRSSQSPQAWWSSGPVYADGVESLSMDHTSGGVGVVFFNCQGCWVKGVRSVRNSTTGTAWPHVASYVSNRTTVRDSYFYGYPADTYALAAAIASDLLWENNIFQNCPAPQVYNSDCEGCVTAYNFSINNNYANSANWQSQSLTYHSTNLFGLAEGNVGATLYADSFHGTHAFNTLFRNRYDGRESNNGTMTTSNTIPVRLNPKTRYQNVIGNVLGTSGYHNNYQATPTATGSQYTSVFSLGIYPEGGETADSLVVSTLLRWGNWDTVSAANKFVASEVPSSISQYANAVPSTQTLPASFYLSGKPSWWTSGKPWPAIGPDVTGGNIANTGGHAYTLPAQDCYTSMGGPANGVGSAISFDAASCYGSSSQTVVVPPTQLNGVAK
jgi:hypothetical protein